VRLGLGAVLRQAALVVSAGGYPRREGERIAGRPLDHLVEGPPGVGAARYAAGSADRADDRRRFGLDPDALVLVSVSRLVPRKGMDVLIRASAALRTRHPGLVLLIAGAGRDARRLGRLIRGSGAPARLVGRVTDEDKVALLRCADV